jgi:hypothetical protein
MLRNIDIDLVYQPLIDGPPAREGDLHQKAASADDTTITHWRPTWVKNYQATHDRFKNFAEHSIGMLYNRNQFKPAIICGSGPSLKHSLEALKKNAEEDNPLLTISCLHNFGLFEDEGFHADYYLTVDSGKIVLDDVDEGRNSEKGSYWDKTKGKTLLACVLTDPEVFEKWQGEIYLFNCLIPDEPIRVEFDKIQRFAHYVSTGGNALGACLYIAKAIFGSDPIHFVGADFCFDYNNQFHSYKTHYDAIGQYMLHTDVFGNKRKTWGSYLNFKYWFDWVACNIPGRFINCSEGLMGAYPEGNIRQFTYMPLSQALIPYEMTDRVYWTEFDAKTNAQTTQSEIKLKEVFKDSKYEKNIVLF